jgi:NAD(P)-dependent dehydrogenase (short-subunit alcohol dehydrogenase family)
MTKRLDGRIALVTGASRGIGAAVALAYAKEGAHVIAIARTSQALEELDDQITAVGGSATLVPLDLLEHDAIDQVGGQIFQRWGKLDILVGNAAILGDLAPLGHFEPKMFQRIFNLNVTANFRLIRAMDPLLRQSDAGRGIFPTSGITRNLQPFWGVYSASKAALEAMVVSYAAELQNTNIRVNLINPGPTRTNLRHAAFPGEDTGHLPPPEHANETFIQMAMPNFNANGLWIAADAAGSMH